MGKTRRGIYIALGAFFLVLGAIGAFVPLLPTTPFWLLTAWFWLRSSGRLYDKAMSNKHFGGVVKGFMIDKSITLQTKVISISVMWISAILTILFLLHTCWLQLLLFLISTGVTWHILSFPTRGRG